jgi:RNA polymerase subunit RPABC4/transcription elongation factor Spt4
MKKACVDCRVLVEKGSECPICKNDEFSTNWKSMLLVFDEDSEIAEEAEITAPGTYAVKVRE